MFEDFLKGKAVLVRPAPELYLPEKRDYAPANFSLMKDLSRSSVAVIASCAKADGSIPTRI